MRDHTPSIHTQMSVCHKSIQTQVRKYEPAQLLQQMFWLLSPLWSIQTFDPVRLFPSGRRSIGSSGSVELPGPGQHEAKTGFFFLFSISFPSLTDTSINGRRRPLAELLNGTSSPVVVRLLGPSIEARFTAPGGRTGAGREAGRGCTAALRQRQLKLKPGGWEGGQVSTEDRHRAVIPAQPVHGSFSLSLSFPRCFIRDTCFFFLVTLSAAVIYLSLGSVPVIQPGGWGGGGGGQRSRGSLPANT